MINHYQVGNSQHTSIGYCAQALCFYVSMFSWKARVPQSIFTIEFPLCQLKLDLLHVACIRLAVNCTQLRQ